VPPKKDEIRKKAHDRLSKKKEIEEDSVEDQEIPKKEEKQKKPASMSMGIFYILIAMGLFIGFIAINQTTIGVIIFAVVFFIGYKQVLDSLRR
jgi:hypothetical protein